MVNTKIGLAERNRPSEFGDPIEAGEEAEGGILAMLSGGMDPEQVADLVFDSIVEQRCYILPHPAWDDVLSGRVEHVLARGAPLTIDFEEMMRRRAAGQQV